VAFMDRGLVQLRGVPGRRRLFAARWHEEATDNRRSGHTRAAVRVTHPRSQKPVDTADASRGESRAR
jgi:hypothetical protein